MTVWAIAGHVLEVIYGTRNVTREALPRLVWRGSVYPERSGMMQLWVARHPVCQVD